MNDKKIYDSAIVGMGPGGLTAAIYLKRFNLDIITFEKSRISNKLYGIDEINNYPGLPGKGSMIADHFKKQVEDNDITVINSFVSTIQKNDDIFQIQTEDGFYYAKSIIIATGLREKVFKIKGEETFSKRGISRCAICDGPLYKKRNVAVYGHKTTAIIEGDYLADIAPKVYFIADDKLEGNEEDIKRLKSHPNIEFFENYEIDSVKGERTLTNISLKNKTTNEIIDIEANGLFLYVGSSTNTEFLPFPEIFDERGYIKVNTEKKTAIPGLFAVGDITTTPLKQVIVAAGDGAIAALSVKQYINSIK